MTFAKGIGSGFPIAGVAANEKLFDRMLPNALGGTFGGNGVAMAAANATLDVIDEEGLCGNAETMGARIKEGLERIAGIVNGGSLECGLYMILNFIRS
jgi:4-aminobutyrate aminotransferase